MSFVHRFRIFHSTIFRLAGTYVALFALAVASLGFVIYFATSVALIRGIDTQIANAATTLQDSYRSGGLLQLIADVKKRLRDRQSNTLLYLVLDREGTPLAGQLPITPKQSGWSYSEYADNESDGDIDQVRILFTSLPGGTRLAVASDLEQIENTKDIIAASFVSAFFAVVLLGTAAVIALSIALLRRVDAIRLTAEAIGAGDLSKRIPLRGNGDDLDRLSVTLNHMLDRIANLMESLRQVSSDIAHDLKTPLVRLRQRLEAGQLMEGNSQDHRALIEAAMRNVDEILVIFGALLRIAQVEAGTRRAGFRHVNVSAILTTVVEAFAPAAEDLGHTLTANIAEKVYVLGDRELLTQLFANLVENAIRHTPAGTKIMANVHADAFKVTASIVDSGPGIPKDERTKVFRRFYRLERARSTPGNGLGLSLVKAIADLHDASIEVEDAAPGLGFFLKFRIETSQVVTHFVAASEDSL
jgi:signal transduction histidine kinase